MDEQQENIMPPAMVIETFRILTVDNSTKYMTKDE